MSERRIHVLDTNVLLHDPTALFRFKEHDIFLPMMVLEELDRAKKGPSEMARNARQVSRFLNELVEASDTPIAAGVLLQLPDGLRLDRQPPAGRLYFQTLADRDGAQQGDSAILAATLALRDGDAGRTVVLVSKDINLRIKATIIGIHAEDYQSDRALDDFDLLFSGYAALPDGFWESHPEVRSWNHQGHTRYALQASAGEDWHNQQFLHDSADELQLRVLERGSEETLLETIDDYRRRKTVWGVSARNREQNFALNALMDPEIDFVSLLGTAGTGKTLLALAAGLAQVMEKQLYREIIMTRATVSVGEDIGFLPGTEEEKMTPWMGALTDNLEVLTESQEGGSWGRAATADLLNARIKVRSMSFMRGRTFLQRYVIVDEAQNLTPKQIKTLLTRAGPGTKMICLGNVEQIDTPYLTETTSGLTYAVDRFKDWAHSAHVTLRRGERSRLADFASEKL